MKKNQIHQKDGGFTLIEAMICVFLMSVGILGISKMQIASLRAGTLATNIMTANFESITAADMLLSMDYATVASVTGTAIDWPTSSDLTIQYVVSSVSPYNSGQNYLSILMTTTWTDRMGNYSIQRTLTKLP